MAYSYVGGGGRGGGADAAAAEAVRLPVSWTWPAARCRRGARVSGRAGTPRSRAHAAATGAWIPGQLPWALVSRALLPPAAASFVHQAGTGR